MFGEADASCLGSKRSVAEDGPLSARPRYAVAMSTNLRHAVAAPLALLVMSATSCFVNMSGASACTPERNCIRNEDGTVECDVGYRWEDEADADNYRCVPDVPDAGDLAR